MKRRWLIWLVVSAAVVVAAVLLRPSREPSYQGESFTYWIEHVPTLPDKTDPAVQAIRQMGQEALPCLVKRFKQKPSLAERVVWDVLGPKTPFLPSGWFQKKRAWEIQDSASEVLKHFGPEAAEAAPIIIECLKYQDKRIREHAVEVLGAIGPVRKEIVPALVDALGDEDTAYQASQTLATFAAKDKSVVPVLVSRLRKSGPKAAYWAVVALEGIRLAGHV